MNSRNPTATATAIIHRKPRGTLSPAAASWLKAGVISIACVLGIGLGLASAAWGHNLLAAQKGAPRRVSLAEVHASLDHQARICVEEPDQGPEVPAFPLALDSPSMNLSPR